MPVLNGDIMKWARETAGFSMEEAAAKLKLNGNRSCTGEQKLAAFESGDNGVSSAVLEKMSKVYRRPLLVFYLAAPPAVASRGTDFRTRPGNVGLSDNPNLDALVRNVIIRQSLLRSALEDDETAPLPFVGSMNEVNDAPKLAAEIKDKLAFELQDFRAQKDISAAFHYLRQKIEQLGVFVLLNGDLGSHHTKVEPTDFSGFAIADNIAPVIVINAYDAKSARSFTALHELAHIFLGSTGLSSYESDNNIEKFCNKAAGAILLPTQDLHVFDGTAPDTLLDQVETAARDWNLSNSMVAYCLYLHNRIDRQTWQELAREFKARWDATNSRQHRPGGPQYLVLTRSRLGNGLMAAVRQQLRLGNLTRVKAGQILAVKPTMVDSLLSDLNPHMAER